MRRLIRLSRVQLDGRLSSLLMHRQKLSKQQTGCLIIAYVLQMFRLIVVSD
jgi:hypothetical protein